MNHVLIRLTRKHALDVALKRIICIKITIKNNLSELAGVFIRLQEFSKQAILTKKVAFNLHLTLDEILNNIISYGYEDTALHFIDITLQKKNERIYIFIKDDSKKYDITKKKILILLHH